jgi:rod shape-determining protein MreC
VQAGTLVLSSGLGGVYPKGIPVGTVTGVVREQAGWERVYRLLPAANPGAVAHVMVLVAPPDASMERAFPSDSALEAMRLDSIAKVRQADSIATARAEAAKAAAAARAEAAAKAAAARATPRPAPPPPVAAPPTPAAGDSAR